MCERGLYFNSQLVKWSRLYFYTKKIEKDNTSGSELLDSLNFKSRYDNPRAHGCGKKKMKERQLKYTRILCLKCTRTDPP